MSALWHLLVLAILVQEVHPFQIPQETPTVSVQLMPPLAPTPPQPEPKPPLQRLEPKPAPTRAPPMRVDRPVAPVAAKPLTTRTLTVPALPDIAPPAPEALRTAHAVASQRIQIDRPPSVASARPALSRPLDTTAPPVVAPTPSLTPPAPVAPPAPTLAPAAPAAPTAAPAPVAPPKPVSIAPPSDVASHRAAPIPVLTNDQTAPGPIEIKPPDRPQEPGRAGAPALPPSDGGTPVGGGGGGGSAGGGGATRGPRTDFNGPIAGFEEKGLRTTLGCLNPETYHLTPAEREACLQRVAHETRGLKDLGPNIPPDKKAEYDRQAACHEANRGGAVPDPADNMGLGVVQRLRDCGPGDR
ncbi:MAG TPA: hypothetical protein VMU59_11955 [Caulobacteraceae bacterium]|nr:hypothetical protein [Caulobacteraceae bacterium]